MQDLSVCVCKFSVVEGLVHPHFHLQHSGGSRYDFINGIFTQIYHSTGARHIR